MSKMYKNNNIKTTTNKEVYTSYHNNIKSTSFDSIPIIKKIKDIFNANDYVYKADVYITTDKETIKKTIIARNKDNLITIDNEYIPISMIRDIHK